MTEPTSEMELAFEQVFTDPHDAAQEILHEHTVHARRNSGIGLRGEPSPFELYNEAIGKLDTVYGELRAEVDAIKAKPPRPHRTGSAARMNPDDIRMARGVLLGTGLFGIAAFVVSFGGQLAMAPYTRLQPELYWFVPFVIEAPIILLSFMIAVFRRRKQHTAIPWLVVTTLTLLSSIINVAHVYIESGGLAQLGDWFGATVMGIAPLLVLVSFEEFVRLAVKPEREASEPAAAARKTTTPRKRASK